MHFSQSQREEDTISAARWTHWVSDDFPLLEECR